jgi:hypothetical protein
MVGLVGVGMAYCEDAPKRAITKDKAINIAQQFLLKEEPKLDIKHKRVNAIFRDNSSISFNGEKTIGYWEITYMVPAPSGYSIPIISLTVTLDRWGKQVGAIYYPLTNNPSPTPQ